MMDSIEELGEIEIHNRLVPAWTCSFASAMIMCAPRLERKGSLAQDIFASIYYGTAARS